MAREYILVDITAKMSSRGTGQYIYEVGFIDLEDLHYYMSVVDPTMRNWTRCGWEHICSGDIPYGVYTGLIRTSKHSQKGESVISADSYPQMTMPMTEQEITEVVREITIARNITIPE